MMQLLCDGRYLDLYDSADVQFTHDNPLFAFDDLKCERTTQFKLPTTPINDSVLALARIPAYSGIGMRRKFDAQLILGTIVKDGYLYVGSYDGKDYQCIFVTGELVGLQAIRNLGNIDGSEIFADNKSAVPALQGSVDGEWARDANNKLWANVNYMRDGDLHPSINIQMLLSEMGVTDSSHILDGLNLRWIPQKMRPVQDDFLDYNIIFKNTSDGSYVLDDQPPHNISIFLIEGLNSAESYIDEAFFEYTRVMVGYTSGSTNYRGYMVEYRAKYDTILDFAGAFPSDCFIGYFNEQTSVDQKYTSLSDFHFLGNYSFDAGGSVSGSPLAGSSLRITAGTLFCIIKKSWWTSGGWNVSTPDYEIRNNGVIFESFQDDPPKIWRLKDNLPKCTAITILKSVAAMTGTVLRYTEENGVFFQSIILDGAVEDISDKVLKSGTLTRDFCNYGQHNIVKFADDDSLYDNEIAETDYTINNVNLEEEKILLSMPASNGGLAVGTTNRLMVRGEEQSADVFARYINTDEVYLSRVSLIKNSDIQTLCDASTQFKVNIRMSAYEYYQITEKTLLNIDGTLYIWTARTWQKDIGQFTLAKI